MNFLHDERKEIALVVKHGQIGFPSGQDKAQVRKRTSAKGKRKGKAQRESARNSPRCVFGLNDKESWRKAGTSWRKESRRTLVELH